MDEIKKICNVYEENKNKIGKIEDQKNQLMIEREKAETKINMQKMEMINRINKIQRQNKEIQPETIKEIFPDSQSLFDEVVKLKEWQKEEEKRRKLDNYENESIKLTINYNIPYKDRNKDDMNYNEKGINKITIK